MCIFESISVIVSSGEDVTTAFGKSDSDDVKYVNSIISSGLSVLYCNPGKFNKAALMKNGGLFAQGDIKEIFSDKILTEFFGTKSTVLWSDKHFFINLDLNVEHRSNITF